MLKISRSKVKTPLPQNILRDQKAEFLNSISCKEKNSLVTIVRLNKNDNNFLFESISSSFSPVYTYNALTMFSYNFVFIKVELKCE